VVGEICNSPGKAPIQDTGARRVLLVLSFCTQGDLSKSEHMLRLLINSASVKSWVGSNLMK
jgi:hypothetical protein